MNTLNFLKPILFVVILTTSFTLSAQEDKIIPYSQVPTQIKEYVSTHFSEHKVIQSEIDDEVFSKSYEIYLKGGFKLEFNDDNRIVSLDSHDGLPNNVVPKRILQYVKTNYPKSKIMDWELDDGKQNIELENGLDLEFTKEGKFLRIDD